MPTASRCAERAGRESKRFSSRPRMLAPRADDLTKNPADGGVSGIPRKGDGGADGDRTHDLRDANATLSQLSYRPTRLRIIRSRRARGQDRKSTRLNSSH